MGGRKSHDQDGKSGRREQAEKQVRGFARGHGAHHRHRPGKDAPRSVASGRDRTTENTRRKPLGRMGDDALWELSNVEKAGEVERRIEKSEEAGAYGTKLEGFKTRGLVIEVRKGNFLTQVLSDPEPVAPVTDAAVPNAADPNAKTARKGDVLKTFVRGTLQQFDLGLSSVVAPGDLIEMIIPPVSGGHELFQADLHGFLTYVVPRRSEFRRLHPSGRAIQTLAANVDRVFVIASTAEPDFRPGFVDRVLVCAAASGLSAALVLNKIDLGVSEDDEELLSVYRSLNVPVFKLSVRNAGAAGSEMEALKDALANGRNLLTGHSGVGKSSLLLALDPALSAERVRTGEVSTQTGKGTHTTTHARLFSLDLGNGRRAEVIDTPGVREFTPTETDRRNLWGWFPEIAKLQGQCPYADCTHTVEKSCAVLAAVERGEIHPRRHHSYVRIYQTLPH